MLRWFAQFLDGIAVPRLRIGKTLGSNRFDGLKF